MILCYVTLCVLNMLCMLPLYVMHRILAVDLNLPVLSGICA